jgi:hypothetical protein
VTLRNSGKGTNRSMRRCGCALPSEYKYPDDIWRTIQVMMKVRVVIQELCDAVGRILFNYGLSALHEVQLKPENYMISDS